MKKPIIHTFVLALMFALAACDENNIFTSVSSTPDSTTDANSLQSDSPPDNSAISDSPLVGTWHVIESGSHGNARYYWSFGRDGRFAYLFSGYEPPQGGGSIDSSVRERFMKGKFRENSGTIECYDIRADDFFTRGDNWRYFPNRAPALLAGILLETSLIESENVNDFSFDFEFISPMILRLVVDRGDFPDQYGMDFEYAGGSCIDVIPGDERRSGVPLFEYLNDTALISFADNFENDFPLSVSVRYDGEASGEPVTVTEPEVIRMVFEALSNITVLGEWPESGHTDDYLNYYFEMPNGNIIRGFVFQDGMLLDEWMGLHEITGFDALQEALPDPGL